MILPHRLYDPLKKWTDYYKVNIGLVAGLVQRESNWNPDAVGDGGHSIGLGQLHDQGAGAGMSVEQRRDPDQNLMVVCRYLAGLIDATPTVDDALSAYNQGLGGWQQNGILDSQRQYIADIRANWQRITLEGLAPDSGSPAPPAGAQTPGTVTVTLPRGLAAELVAILEAVL